MISSRQSGFRNKIAKVTWGAVILNLQGAPCTATIFQRGTDSGPEKEMRLTRETGIPVGKITYWINGGWDRETTACAEGPSIIFSDVGDYRVANGGGVWIINDDLVVILKPRDSKAVPMRLQLIRGTNNSWVGILDGKELHYVRCLDPRQQRARTVAQ